ncbi:autotransporter outer membrane beta-barrel domain-containing protein [Veillonella montpellierensis]|uniref:autotransporter outer membrane beta-barrel domain-containing protein n=1 Tax=Veillonella montpellierensis TaxID=187328 RepID=UPI0023F97713|nr:autotransporter outer membrane beta-barrel domain-containing protein [Veillonella montpellierensis]
MKGRYIKKGVALGMLLAVASTSMTMAMEARIRAVNRDTQQVTDIIEGAPPVTLWEGLTTEGRPGRMQVELQRDGDEYKLIVSGEVEGRSESNSWSRYLSREELNDNLIWRALWYEDSKTGKRLVELPSLAISYNNKIWIEPTRYDDSSDFAKASRYCLDRRPSYRVPVTDSHFVWVTYDKNRLDTLYNGPKTKKGGYIVFSKSEDMKIVRVGLDRIKSDTMTQGIYFLYGSDRTKYYRKTVFDDQIRAFKNDGGIHVANSRTTMYGLGIHQTKRWKQGTYYDAYLQGAMMRRHVWTVNEGVYNTQTSDNHAHHWDASLEVGHTFTVNKRISIQPELQYTYSDYHQSGYTDSLEHSVAAVHKTYGEARLGVKATYGPVYVAMNRYMTHDAGENYACWGHEIGIDTSLPHDIQVHAVWARRQNTDTHRNQKSISLAVEKKF